MVGHNPGTNRLDFGGNQVWIRIWEFFEGIFNFTIFDIGSSSSLVQQQFQNTQASRPQTERIKGCLGRGLRCQTVRVHPALSIIVDCGVEERAGRFYRADDGEKKKNLFFSHKNQT